MIQLDGCARPVPAPPENPCEPHTQAHALIAAAIRLQAHWMAVLRDRLYEEAVRQYADANDGATASYASLDARTREVNAKLRPTGWELVQAEDSDGKPRKGFVRLNQTERRNDD
jgi:hypothetical protein